MTLYVNEVEALWVVVTAGGFVLCLTALVDAISGFRAAQGDAAPSHEVRLLTAKGNVRRESLRLVVMALLLSIAVPALFSDRPITLTPVLIALILVPVVLATSSLFDFFDRNRLAAMLVDLIRVERDALALESSVQENIALTKEATAKSVEAIEIGNHSREALMQLTAIVGGKEDKP